MQEQNKSDNDEQGNLLNIINPALYCETCPDCRMPARLEMVTEDYPIGVDYFAFCVNPQCINFDATYLRRKREQLVAAVKESKSWRRWRKRAWKVGVALFKQEQKRTSELYRH